MECVVDFNVSQQRLSESNGCGNLCDFERSSVAKEDGDIETLGSPSLEVGDAHEGIAGERD